MSKGASNKVLLMLRSCCCNSFLWLLLQAISRSGKLLLPFSSASSASILWFGAIKINNRCIYTSIYTYCYMSQQLTNYSSPRTLYPIICIQIETCSSHFGRNVNVSRWYKCTILARSKSLCGLFRGCHAMLCPVRCSDEVLCSSTQLFGTYRFGYRQYGKREKQSSYETATIDWKAKFKKKTTKINTKLRIKHRTNIAYRMIVAAGIFMAVTSKCCCSRKKCGDVNKLTVWFVGRSNPITIKKIILLQSYRIFGVRCDLSFGPCQK